MMLPVLLRLPTPEGKLNFPFDLTVISVFQSCLLLSSCQHGERFDLSEFPTTHVFCVFRAGLQRPTSVSLQVYGLIIDPVTCFSFTITNQYFKNVDYIISITAREHLCHDVFHAQFS